MDRVFKLPSTTFIGRDKEKSLPLRYIFKNCISSLFEIYNTTVIFF